MTAPIDVELVAGRAALLADWSGLEHRLFDPVSGLEVVAIPGLPPIVWAPEPAERADLEWYADMCDAAVAGAPRPPGPPGLLGLLLEAHRRLYPSDGA